MVSPAYIVGLGAGLVSTALFLSLAGGMNASLFLLYLSSLPLFIAAFGWGVLAALTAAFVGTVLIGMMLSVNFGIIYGGMIALPTVVLSYLASLHREVPISGDSSSVGQAPVLEWYPVERIIIWAAFIAGTVATVALFAMGSDPETYRQSLTAFLEKSVFESLKANKDIKLSEEEIALIKEFAVRAFPAVFAVAWFFVTLFYMWLGMKVADISGRLVRPRPILTEMRFPPVFSLVFMGALAVTFVSGMVGLAASAYAGTFYFAFLFLGLAIFYQITPNAPGKPMIFFLFCLAVFLVGWIGFVVALVGLSDPLLRLRERIAARAAGPD